MSDDVLGRPARDDLSETGEPMVAQHRRNRQSALVAQPTPTPGDRSTHIRSINGNRNRTRNRNRVSPVALGLAVWTLLGCASPTTAVKPPDGGPDSALVTCESTCNQTGQSCSYGRCTSMACRDAEKVINSSVGCRFYTLQPDNVTADEAAVTSFLVTTQGPDPANVELQQLMPGDGGLAWAAIAGGQVAGGGASLRLPVSALEVTGVGVTTAGALRLSSDRPVTVAEIASDDTQLPGTSSGGSMILPLQALNSDYRVMTYPQQTSPDIEQTVGSRGGAARVIVVGTQPNTTVTFTPVTPVTADPNGYTPGLDAGVPYQVVLGDGDVFQIYSGAEGEDLTGAQVSSTAPVAVFSGNISTSYGSQVAGINSADMAYEQMPPVAAWSESYVAAALTPQASIGCTSFFGIDGASIWRVLAGHDGTTVTLSGTATGLPAPFSLDAGQSRSIVVAGSFAVDANYPVLVTQGIDCEPSLSVAIAVDSTPLYTNLPFAVPPGFDLLLGIVRPTGAEVDLDGPYPIAAAQFTRVGSKYEVAAISLPACAPTDGSGVCTHRLTSPVGFGMSVRGMDVRSSYVLTAPLLVLCATGSTEFCLN
jgi:hypothetical protein